MKIVIINGDKAVLTPTGGKIRDRLTNRLYSEVSVKPSAIWRYEDADSVQYEEVQVETLPDDVRELFDQVVQLIVGTAMAHDAIDDLKAMGNINIANLFALAHNKGVSDPEMTAIVMKVVTLKTDIEARMPRSWYDMWNGNLKPYIVAALASRSVA